jgi:NAD(P)-dependent dehydrogenase (short-subunit alcohol dehydrogenase family)
MLLEKKNAVIYGAGGGIGGGVARTFAREGARVFLTGRRLAPLQALAEDIRAAGGSAEVAEVDATDERAVGEHAAAVVADAGSIDVSFNLISRGDVQGIPLVEMTPEQITGAVNTALLTTFLTARAAARQMASQGSGVILAVTSGTARVAAPMMGSTGPADAALESFLRCLAAEVGPQGVRVLGIHTAGVVETLDPRKVLEVNPDTDLDKMVEMLAQMTILKRAPRLAQIAETAAFLASDHAGAITATTVNASCGMVPG